MQHPVATVYDDDPLAAVRTSPHGVQNPPVDEKEGCSTCDWQYSCAGGCPLETQHATGRADLPSPNCGIYQAIYPAALRLEQCAALPEQHAEEVLPSSQVSYG
jgi:sulfatase maturation enzyme AslB (radical SAM superfamily)